MIKLDVQEYCHGCANFTADVKEPEKYHADFDIIEMTDTLVRCEHRKLCENLVRYLSPKINESLIIGVDFSKRDDGVLIVGRQKNGEVTIINAFQGKEAFDIYEKLITVKKGGGNDGAVKTSGAMSKMPVQR